MSNTQRLRHSATSTDNASLRLAARLLLAGQLLFIVITQFHTGGDANDHSSIFGKYADSGDWKGVHALQFGAVGVIVAGLVVLYLAIEERTDGPSWAARVGAVLAVASLALYGVLQAVDGVGNKQVDQAWVNAGTGQKPARFASAEAMRWLEWGVSSYHAYAAGLSLILLAAAATAVRAATLPRAVPYLVALTGIAYLAQGWVAGSQGFNAAHSILIVVSWVLSVAWMAWLTVSTWRTPHTTAVPSMAQ
jgi:hypothetical protein